MKTVKPARTQYRVEHTMHQHEGWWHGGNDILNTLSEAKAREKIVLNERDTLAVRILKIETFETVVS